MSNEDLMRENNADRAFKKRHGLDTPRLISSGLAAAASQMIGKGCGNTGWEADEGADPQELQGSIAWVNSMGDKIIEFVFDFDSLIVRPVTVAFEEGHDDETHLPEYALEDCWTDSFFGDLAVYYAAVDAAIKKMEQPS